MHGNVYQAGAWLAGQYVELVFDECVRYFVRGAFPCPVPDAYPVPFLRVI
jgi:hypothetical protein